MSITFHQKIRSGKLKVILSAVLLGVLAYPLSALAVLGGDVTSVHADRARMKAALRSTHSEAYTVHEILSPNGTMVKEYSAPNGKVFAVVWQGPFMPNLHELFGHYFEQYSKAAQTRKSNQQHIRGPLLIRQPGLVVQTGGHMRAYFGKAYIPEMVPQGVNIEDIK
ncbi:MAG TPA: DUF2844 domain-containing protein [Desulfomonilia bacterium]|nr:DUF2844 domain-containing protein [Desulfomonilia bacterium]